MKTIKNLLFLLFSFGIQGAAVLDDFRAFPAYVITFARETPEDDDYPQLTAKEQEIVLNVLRNVLQQPNGLPRNLVEYGESKQVLLRNYNGVRQPIYERFRRFLDAPDSIECLHAYLNEKLDFKWLFDYLATDSSTKDEFSKCRNIQDVSEFVTKSLTLPAILELVPASKRSLYVEVGLLKIAPRSTETVLQKHILRFMQPEVMLDYFEKKLQSEAEAIFRERFQGLDYEEASYLSRILVDDTEFFARLQQELQQLTVQLDKVANVIRGNSCLVVFNEMFFGKAKTAECTGLAYAPLAKDKKAELDRYFLELSRITPQAVFYVNHLHETDPVLGRDFSSRLNLVDTAWKAMPPPHHELFEAAGISDIPGFLTSIIPDHQYHTFANETFIYNRGAVVGKYLKTTYKDEADELLRAGHLYLFGDGKEEILVDNPIQKLLSTETCFDLKLGIRRKFNNYPLDCKMHIITSNTLPFSLTDKTSEVRENFSHFPAKVPFILHVDPHQQDLFVRISSKKNFFFDKHQSEKPTSHDIYQRSYPEDLIAHDAIIEVKFGIGKNVFTIKVFDMRAAQAKLHFYE